jgi:hypothetical protein
MWRQDDEERAMSFVLVINEGEQGLARGSCG